MRKYLFWLFMSILPFLSYAQTVTYHNLVFEGGGIRGIAYSGVIKVLEQEHMLPGIQKVGGTSAGAITALMVALGYSSEEIYHLAEETPFEQFNDGKYWFAGGWSRMRRHYGWYRKQAFERWLGDVISRKTGNADITFAAMQAAGYKSLYVTGTCLNRQQLLVFSRETYPDMKVKDAVSISMSIPLYFEASFIDAQGKVYRDKRMPPGLDIVVDGGLTGNFPIFLFDRIDNTVQPALRIPDPATLGVRIDEPEQISLDGQQTGTLAPASIRNLNSYIAALYVYTIENLNRNTLTQADWDRTISISSAGIGPRIRKLSESEKQQLISSGAAYTKQFLEK